MRAKDKVRTIERDPSGEILDGPPREYRYPQRKDRWGAHRNGLVVRYQGGPYVLLRSVEREGPNYGCYIAAPIENGAIGPSVRITIGTREIAYAVPLTQFQRGVIL